MKSVARVFLSLSLPWFGHIASAQTLPAFVMVDGFERVQAMRIDTVLLRDPHMFYGLPPLIPCTDVTDTVNAEIASALDADADMDGFLDNSPMLFFQPLHTGGRSGLGRIGDARCSAPATGTTCEAGTQPLAPMPYGSRATGTCLATIPETLRPYDPPVAESLGPCFASEAADVDLDFGLPLPLEAARIGGSRRDNPAPGLEDGLLYGFLAEEAADIIPVTLPLIGTVPLSSLLPGGTGNCAAHSDMDEHEGVPGWWFYFNYSADEVPYSN